jgi:hypothetical protein
MFGVPLEIFNVISIEQNDQKSSGIGFFLDFLPPFFQKRGYKTNFYTLGSRYRNTYNEYDSLSEQTLCSDK